MQIDLALGFSHTILMDIPDGIKVTVTDGTKLKVEGADKQLVGAVTAEIRSYYPPEPYKGKGVRIVGEHAERVRRKEGKTVA
jgi:large subunit ribosomal protein L6